MSKRLRSGRLYETDSGIVQKRQKIQQKPEKIVMKYFDDNEEKREGLHMIVSYTKDKESFSSIYKVKLNEGKKLDTYDINDYNINDLLTNKYGEIPLATIKSLVARANNRTINGTEGVCQGSISSSFIKDQIKIEQNNTFMILIDFSADKADNIKGFIIARTEKEDEESDNLSYYIDIICAEPGFGTILLKWFINFLFERNNIDNSSDPSYNVKSLSLSAISSVLYYYPIFGYLNVKSCPGKESNEVINARSSVPLDGKARDIKSNEFINFLYVLTRQGLNNNDDKFCLDIANTFDFNNKKVLNEKFLSNRNLNSIHTYTNRLKNVNEYTKETITNANKEYNKVFKEYTKAKKDHDENISDENLTEIYNIKKKEYFDAAFNYAKNIYIYSSGCDSHGYKMYKCKDAVR